MIEPAPPSSDSRARTELIGTTAATRRDIIGPSCRNVPAGTPRDGHVGNDGAD
jgi:hypothetical protein